MTRPRLFMAAAALVAAATVLPARQPSIDDFFRALTDEWVRHDPNLAAFTRYFSGEEQDRLERRLTPLTRAYREASAAIARRGLERLRAFDRAALTETQRLSADVLEWHLEQIVAGTEYEDYFFPLEQFNGANVYLVNLLTVAHPVVTPRDAENYVARLGEVAPRMREAIAEARRVAARGLIPPRFILQATIAQMRQFLEPPPAQNPFVTAFAAKLGEVEDLPSAARERLIAGATREVGEAIYPAWREGLALVESLVPKASDDAGLSRLPGGAEAYAYFLRRFTSTDLTPDRIHEIGLRRVAEIEREMDAIFRRLGRTEGTVQERAEALKRDLAYPLTDEGRTRIMADIEAMMRDAERRAAPMFLRTPKAPVIARPYPRFREASAAASYTPPSPDGTRPGIFQMPLRPDRMTRFALRSLVYHETVPGHHFQIALNVENTDLPRFRQIRAFGGISAYSEGWALYAERLAVESGWYEGDPEGLLGALDSELFRARRLVADTGLHVKGWTRQQAIDYGIPPSEVDRYVVFPGQACSYMIGQLRILELRDRARAALGAAFSPERFHDTVLATGIVPLSLLERQVDAYIARTKGTSSGN